MNIHFIGLGERIMGDLAMSLSQQGHAITGSDVAYSDTSFNRLRSEVPSIAAQNGWFPQHIQSNLDMIIVGSEVHADNPELQAAQQLGLPICSYPEYIYRYAQDKQRIVIMGGTEKKLLCLLVLHVLEHLHQPFDYIVASPKLEASVQLSNAPIIIIEGGMTPASCLDTQPQSLYYQHNMALIGGVGWESNSTDLTLEAYLAQLTKLADASPKGGTLIYYEEDNLIHAIGSQARADVRAVPYQAHPHRYKEQQAYLIAPQKDILSPDGAHVMCAIAGAQQLLRNLAISDQPFYEALATFFEK